MDERESDFLGAVTYNDIVNRPVNRMDFKFHFARPSDVIIDEELLAIDEIAACLLIAADKLDDVGETKKAKCIREKVHAANRMVV